MEPRLLFCDTPPYCSPLMATSLFTYGTLLFPEIMDAVVGCSLPAQRATLHGYQRYRVRGCVYPALATEQRSLVEGRLYIGLHERLWHRLDAFEGSLYERIEVPVVVGRALQAAQVYIIKEPYQHELSRDIWDVDVFNARYKRGYLAACRQAVPADESSRYAERVTG